MNLKIDKMAKQQKPKKAVSKPAHISVCSHINVLDNAM